MARGTRRPETLLGDLAVVHVGLEIAQRFILGEIQIAMDW